MIQIMNRMILIISSILFAFYIGILLIAGFLLPDQTKHKKESLGKYISINKHKLYFEYYNRNASETIIFLHSFGGDVRMWDSLILFFPDKNILVYDMIGFGNSDRPVIDYSLDSQSYFLFNLIKELKIKNPILVGSSMGASVALWFASKFPDRTKKIIVMAPSAYPGSMNHKFPGNLFYKPGVLNALARFFTSNFIFRKLFPNSIAYQAFSVTNSYNKNFILALKKIINPVLLYWSRGDQRSDFNFADKYLQSLRNSSLIIKPDEAGHNIHTYRTEDLAVEINNFINE